MKQENKAPSVSIIIPTLNAANEIGALLDAILLQTIQPKEILVIDSSSDDDTCSIVRQYPSVHLKVISRTSFNHGTTRHEGVLATSGDYIVFFTQDALPTNNELLESLLKPIIEDKTVAAVTARQLPRPDAWRYEQLVREFNYPSTSYKRSLKDLEQYGIKTFFASDVCRAYRREAYAQVGGFDRTNTNEDMFITAKLLHAGFSVAYEATACVIHSHNLTLREQYRRNKEVAISLENNKDLLCGVSEMAEGKKLFKNTMQTLLQEKRFCTALRFIGDCGARYCGNRSGRKKLANLRS